jgi:FMN phosphatase YigB (HAD superfamily)
VEYGWRVLRALGVSDHFERVIGIETVGLRNKVCRDAYEHVLALLGAQGSECIMVEDAVRNLRPAKALGMATVLVGTDGSGRPLVTGERGGGGDTSVDFVVSDVLEVGQVVQRLLDDVPGASGR